VLVFLLTAVSLASIVWLVRRHHMRAKYSILWLSVGAVLVVLAASPDLLDRLSRALGIDYGPATFFLGATALLFLVVIHLSWELSRLEERTRTLAEEIAILKAVVPGAPGGVGGGDEPDPHPAPSPPP
jgi:hypothetical protein